MRNFTEQSFIQVFTLLSIENQNSIEGRKIFYIITYH